MRPGGERVSIIDGNERHGVDSNGRTTWIVDAHRDGTFDDRVDAESLLAQVEREADEQTVLRRPQRDLLYWSEVIANAAVFLLLRNDLALTERQRRVRVRRSVCGTEKRRENLRSRMSKPKRIQRSRAKGWKMPANAIYIGRPTVLGNPYVVGSELMNGETLTAEKAIALYEQHLADNFSERDIRHCLHDKDLACWCALDQPCHADVLLRIANSRPK